MDMKPEGCFRMFALLGVLALPLAAVAAPAPRAAEPVAMITDLAGTVLVQNGATGGSAEVLMSLPAGAALTLPGGARLTLVYFGSAKEYAFAGPDSITLGDGQPDSISGSEADARTLLALAQHSIQSGEVQQLVQAGLQMRSIDLRKRIQLRWPVQTLVTDPTPVFSWTALEPELQYRFSLRDDAGLTILETLQSRPRLRLPSEIVLREGASYSWSVETRARNGSAYAASGDFSVATGEQRAEAERLRVGAEASASERLLNAILLQKLGLHSEAAPVWQQLAAERPESASLQRIAAQAALSAPPSGN